jgi:hypothetical protein
LGIDDDLNQINAATPKMALDESSGRVTLNPWNRRIGGPV